MMVGHTRTAAAAAASGGFKFLSQRWIFLRWFRGAILLLLWSSPRDDHHPGCLPVAHAKEYHYDPGVDMAEAKHAPLMQALDYHNILIKYAMPQLGHLKKYEWLYDFERIQLEYEDDLDDEGPVPCLHLHIRKGCDLVAGREILLPVPVDQLQKQELITDYCLQKAKRFWDLAHQEHLDEQAELAVQKYEASLLQGRPEDPLPPPPPPRADGGVYRQERQVLDLIFDAMEGTQIMRVPGHWKSRIVDHCDWSGIVCEHADFTKEECALALADREQDEKEELNDSNGNEPNSGVYENCVMSVVTRLELPSQQLTGTIPSELARLSHLKALHLNHNFLHGSLPTELTKMTKLEQLFCNHNELTGTFPLLPNARHVSCAHNFLVDGVVHQTSPQLQWLDLSNNALVGSLPTTFLEHTSQLQYLYLSDNAFTGSLPSHFSKSLTDLRTLDLQHNHFTGTVPRLPHSLSDLHLGHNQFFYEGVDDEFPSQLLQLSRLQTLQLSRNQFAGSLPEIWPALSTLGILKLDHNQFGGSIPTTWYTTAKQLREYVALTL